MKNILKNLILFFLILTCVYLGFWQLDRADQKLSIQTDYQNQLSKEYLDLKEVQKNPLRYNRNHFEKKLDFLNLFANLQALAVNLLCA